MHICRPKETTAPLGQKMEVRHEICTSCWVENFFLRNKSNGEEILLNDSFPHIPATEDEAIEAVKTAIVSRREEIRKLEDFLKGVE